MHREHVIFSIQYIAYAHIVSQYNYRKLICIATKANRRPGVEQNSEAKSARVEPLSFYHVIISRSRRQSNELDLKVQKNLIYKILTITSYNKM